VSAEPFAWHGATIPMTASIGFVAMPLPPREKPLPWERAIGLADMALYLAKVNGRNRGYGVLELVDDDNGTLAAVEHDLEAAWRGGLVDVHVLVGTEFPVPLPLPDTAIAGVTPD
jgi:predicted signal transduction protein with EAL and GGDEF domain